jgi:hypothetical protein
MPETLTFPNPPKAVVEAYNIDCSTAIALHTIIPGCTHAIIQASCGDMRVTIDGATPVLGAGEDDTNAIGMFIAKSAFAPDLIAQVPIAKVVGVRVNVWGYVMP